MDECMQQYIWWIYVQQNYKNIRGLCIEWWMDCSCAVKDMYTVIYFLEQNMSTVVMSLLDELHVTLFSAWETKLKVCTTFVHFPMLLCQTVAQGSGKHVEWGTTVCFGKSHFPVVVISIYNMSLQMNGHLHFMLLQPLNVL